MTSNITIKFRDTKTAMRFIECMAKYASLSKCLEEIKEAHEKR